MKIQIYFFAFQNFSQISYKHGQYIPEENLWNVVQEIYESGLNVMVYHIPDPESEPMTIIFIDDKRFQQR